VKIACRLFLSFFLILVLFSSPATAAGQQLRIGMLLWRGETRAEAGFKDGLKALGYSVDYAIFNSEQSEKNLGTLLHSINKNIDAFDYIYTFGTTVSRRAKIVIAGKIPQLFNIVTDPIRAGIVESLASPGGNISGASDAIGIAEQLNNTMQLLSFKRLGFFFNPREKNSMIIRDELHRFGDANGIEIIDFRSPPVQDALPRNLQMLIDNPDSVDAVYLSADSYLVSEAKNIGSQLRKAKLKSIGSVGSYIEHGVLMGVVGDYYQLGRSVANIVDRHQKGENLGKIPVQPIQNVMLMINRTTAGLLGVKIDTSVYAKAVVVD
jgi:putative ABC transport system substrate-binding protein